MHREFHRFLEIARSSVTEIEARLIAPVASHAPVAPNWPDLTVPPYMSILAVHFSDVPPDANDDGHHLFR